MQTELYPILVKILKFCYRGRRIIAHFVFKFFKFYCHHKHGRLRQNLTDVIQLSDPKNHLLDGRISEISLIQAEL